MAKIKLSSPVAGISGKFKNSDVVYYVTPEGETVARAAVVREDLPTPQQVSVRAILAAASGAWQTLTERQWRDWTEYSAEYFRTARGGGPLAPNGHNAFVKANSIRLVLGLEIVADAPTQGPPAGLSGMSVVAGTAGDVLGLEVVHSVEDVGGLQVLVKMTPRTESRAARPRANRLRYCCGAGPASARPLTASGEVVWFSPTQFVLADGDRFGVEAVMVRTADGVVSEAIWGDFMKVG